MSKWRIAGWTLLIAALTGLGWTLYVWLPPQPRWVVTGSLIDGGLAPDGKTLRTLTVTPDREPRRLDARPFPAEPRVTGMQVWDVESGREVISLLSDPGRRWETVFSADGRRLAAVSAQAPAIDAELRVFDVATGEAQRATVQHRATHWRVEFSPGGSLVMVDDGLHHDKPFTLLLYESKSLRQVARLDVREWGSRKWAKDGEALLIFEPGQGGDAALRRIAQAGETVIPFQGAGDWLDISPDGKTLITEPPARDVKDDRWPRVVDSLLIWDLATGKLRHTIPVAGFMPRASGEKLIFLRDMQTLLIRLYNAGPDDFLQVWDMDRGKWLGEIHLGAKYPLTLPAHDLLAVATNQELPGTLTLYRLRPLEKVWHREWPGKVLLRIDVMAGSGRLLAATASATGKEEKRLDGHSLEWLDIETGATRGNVPLAEAGHSWCKQGRFLALTEWHHDTNEHHVILRWLEANVLPVLFPNMARAGRTPTTTRVIDTESRAELCRIDLTDAESRELSADGRSLFIYQEAPPGGEVRLCCYDVPPRRAWQYIAGIPFVIGLLVLITNVGWRRWRGRKSKKAGNTLGTS
jgi:hypothetical protein